MKEFIEVFGADYNYTIQGFKSMVDYFKKEGWPELDIEFIPAYISLTIRVINFYCLLCVIGKCIKNKKITFYDVLYIVLNISNGYWLSEASYWYDCYFLGGCILFIVLCAIYDKLTNEKKKEEKPHAD